MASSGDPELKGGFSISQWVKAKPSDARREFEPFAASPPAHDDSFFYIRYPTAEELLPAGAAGGAAAGAAGGAGVAASLVVQEPREAATARDVDWTRHTKPCRDVLRGIAPVTATANPVAVKPKPAGTDDGFKGEGAACGSSVLKVAHAMVNTSRTASQRGFTVATPAEDEPASPPGGAYLSARRPSRSLPATPLHSPPGSPGSRRRARNTNRFFTSPFEPSDANNSRSWLAAALLGYKKDVDMASTSTLAEEDLESRLQGNSLVASVENLGPAPRMEGTPQPTLMGATQEPKLSKPTSSFRPKPTELREMNFWSPTSM